MVLPNCSMPRNDLQVSGKNTTSLQEKPNKQNLVNRTPYNGLLQSLYNWVVLSPFLAYILQTTKVRVTAQLFEESLLWVGQLVLGVGSYFTKHGIQIYTVQRDSNQP